MNDSADNAPASETPASISSQVADAGAQGTPTKKKLLEEYQDHVGGGGFHAWLSWTYSF